jgi:hypothetical protein
VMVTDGVFDNAFDAEIISIVKADLRGGVLPDPTSTANAIGSLSRTHQNDKAFESPYYVNSGHQVESLGGKLDDISVIVAQITQ